jgi:hypothetical protein
VVNQLAARPPDKGEEENTMAIVKYGIPGVGGSLGMCAVCGESFAAELMLHKAVDAIRISVVDASLPVHEECGALVLKISAADSDWRKLPEGPLREAFQEAERDGTITTEEATDGRV